MRAETPTARAFTLDGYRQLVAGLLDRGYDVRGYGEAESAARHLILRHDLDMSIEAAVPVAETERALGVAATYFVLLRTEMYNPFSGRGLDGLRRIMALGHDIGLHLDASFYGAEPAKIEAAADRECAALEALLEAPVRTVSFHRPAPALLGLEGTLAGRRHAYEPRFFSEMGYCSDSRGAWEHGHPFDHEAVAAGRALQLLTHPIWWTGAAADGPQDKLDRFVDGRDALLRAELARNCEIYDLAARSRAESGGHE